MTDEHAQERAVRRSRQPVAPRPGAAEDRGFPDRVTSAAQQQGLMDLVGALDLPITDPARLDPGEREVVDAAVAALVRETAVPPAEALSVLLLLARTEQRDLVAVAAAVLADAVEPAGRERPALRTSD